MKVEVAVLGSPSLIAKVINTNFVFIIFANSPYGLCGRKATLYRSCVTVEVAVLGSPSLIVPTVSVDVKQH